MMSEEVTVIEEKIENYDDTDLHSSVSCCFCSNSKKLPKKVEDRIKNPG